MSTRALVLFAVLTAAGPAVAQQPVLEGGGRPPAAMPDPAKPAIADGLFPLGPCSTCGDRPGCSTGTSCDDCEKGQAPNVWLGGGYLMLWLSPARARAPLASTGLLGDPGTLVLLGSEQMDYGRFNGGEIHGGLWLNDRHTLALTAGGFLTEQKKVIQSVFGGPGSATAILRPFTDAVTNRPNGLVVVGPGFAGGVETVSSARLAGAEVGILHNVYADQLCRIDFTAGFRYLDFDESFSVYSATTALAGTAAAATPPGVLPQLGAGDSYLLHDYFRGRNQLYLGQIGARFGWRLGPADLGLTTKLGMGPNYQVLQIDGSTQSLGTIPTTVPGALLAVDGPTGTIGRTTGGRFTVAPEAGADVSIQVTKTLRLAFGYNFLYINDVIRPAGQLDPTVNPRLVPASDAFGTASGPVRPKLTFDRDSFHAHGLRFSAEIQY